MNIRFLVDYTYQTGRPEGDPFYKAGEVYDIREDRAQKWMRQGLAVDPSQVPRSATPTAAATAAATHIAGPTAVGRAEHRAARGVDLADPGTGAPMPPNPMTTADMPRPMPPPPTVQEERAVIVPPSEPQPAQDDLENYLREDLLEMVEKRRLETPAGYLSKPVLIKLLRGERIDV